MRTIVWLLVLAIAILHYDFWLWSDRSLLFGFLPVGLAYHAGLSAASGLVWDVVFEPGQNQLEVIGRDSGQEVATDALELTYSDQPFGKPADIRLSASPVAGGQVLVAAVIVAQNGLRVHTSRERIYLSHTNPGSGGYLLKDHGTPDKSATIEAANGRAVILFEPDGAGKGAIIEARTQNLKGSYIELP